MITNMALAQTRSDKRMRVADFLLRFSDEQVPVPKEAEPKPDERKMKFIAQMCTAFANADEDRKHKRKRK